MKTKATSNKNILKPTQLVCLLIALVLMGCSKDDEVAKSSEKEIISFTFLTVNNENLNVAIEATIDETANTITVYLSSPENASLIPTIAVSNKASYSPVGVQDFTNPILYTITAEDASTVNYEVIARIPL